MVNARSLLRRDSVYQVGKPEEWLVVANTTAFPAPRISPTRVTSNGWRVPIVSGGRKKCSGAHSSLAIVFCYNGGCVLPTALSSNG